MIILDDKSTIDKIIEKIMNNNVVDSASPSEILFGDRIATVDALIRESKIEVIDEKIAMLELEYKALDSKVYKTSNKTVNVGDGFNGDRVSVNFINSRRREKILANIVANIEELEEEKKSI